MTLVWPCGIKILRDVAHDPQQLALPGLQARRGLFEEIQQIFLRQPEQLAAPLDVQHRVALDRPGRNGAPQIVEHALLVQAALSGALFFGARSSFFLPG